MIKKRKFETKQKGQIYVSMSWQTIWVFKEAFLSFPYIHTHIHCQHYLCFLPYNVVHEFSMNKTNKKGGKRKVGG